MPKTMKVCKYEIRGDCSVLVDRPRFPSLRRLVDKNEAGVDLADHSGFDWLLKCEPTIVLDDASPTGLSVVCVAEVRGPLGRRRRLLVDYVRGQWSDGWGEGYEQNDDKVKNVFVSPWHPGQKVRVRKLGEEVVEDRANKFAKTVLDAYYGGLNGETDDMDPTAEDLVEQIVTMAHALENI